MYLLYIEHRVSTKAKVGILMIQQPRDINTSLILRKREDSCGLQATFYNEARRPFPGSSSALNRHEAAPLGRGPIAGESGLGSEANGTEPGDVT